MEPLDPELRALIDTGMPAAVPDADTEQRGLQSMLLRVNPPSSILLPDAPPTAAPTAGVAKLLVLTTTLGVAGVVGWATTRPDSPPTPAHSRTEAAPSRKQPPSDHPSRAPTEPMKTVEPTEPPPATLPLPSSPPQTSAVLTRKAPGSPPALSSAAAGTTSAAADALRAEAELIARAESALDQGKPKQALALCDLHRSGFATPQLTLERDAIAISARCVLAPHDRTAARAFISAHPGSALLKKIRSRCELDSDK